MNYWLYDVRPKGSSKPYLIFYEVVGWYLNLFLTYSFTKLQIRTYNFLIVLTHLCKKEKELLENKI